MASVPQGEQLILEQQGAFRASVFISTLNQRVRVLDYQAKDLARLARALVDLTRERQLSKVFVKAHPEHAGGLSAHGFMREATITGFFAGGDAVVMSHFLTDERSRSSADRAEQERLVELLETPVPRLSLTLPHAYTCGVASAGDADELARLYKEVFGSYPFPIFDPAYLKRVMKTHVVFRIVRDGQGRLVAAASAEMNEPLRNAEMTDFATLPDQRGKRLAMFLLEGLELEMADRGIDNLYTLARSSIFGMNKVFHHLGYGYTGRLIKNCHIGGAFEDMLCWCKQPA